MPVVLHDIFPGSYPASQGFGENPATYNPYGLAGHEGVDFPLEAGHEVWSATDGIVTKAGFYPAFSAYGNMVEVWDDKQNCATLYAHFTSVAVTEGQRVQARQLIGHSDTTGHAYGPHLHFGLCLTDPQGNRLNTGNGYFGWIDSLNPANVTWVTGDASPVVSPLMFTGSVTADGGANVRKLPGGDVAAVVDKNTALQFNGWCRHGAGIPDAVTGVSDDRWFRLTNGQWIASAVVNGEPPAGWAAIADPTVTAPTVTLPGPPVPPVAPPSKPASANLQGVGVWEWETAADYPALKAAGADWVVIRATNGSGTGPAKTFEANWATRAAAARAAGLKVMAWTYWYGASEGVTGDVAGYLDQCATYTASLGFQDTPGWVVDAEDRDLPGLAAAVKKLRDLTGKPVYVCPPGDPVEYGMKWTWKELDVVVEGYWPQIYTNAFQGVPGNSPDKSAYDGYKACSAEWTPVAPLFPATDEVDPARIADWVRAAKEAKVPFISYWRAGVGDASTVKAYVDAFKSPHPDPVTTPTPAPVIVTPPSNSATLEAIMALLEKIAKFLRIV